MMSDLLKQIFFDVTFYNNHNLKKIEENCQRNYESLYWALVWKFYFIFGINHFYFSMLNV